ncbi:glycerol-3-phosphate 1-O-acyltransferase PlsY [Rhizobium sp.]|jgi:acyl phosphate:glycerol-3-phosphate acyltransferase|uniref:glycerol-3-phosphate 1-O-acyltransferase PlsY n=1 Tax=Rhizobium sp. TaxID=391 RepID=UPI000E8783B3|nr:glycerol-3-phosphate acyltransferase [Rhizobium sp.]
MPSLDYSQIPLTALIASLAIGYLLGSIPFGLILTRMAGLGDVRKIGSGNIGATNVLRTGNKKLAAATLLLDAFKATAAVLIAQKLYGTDAIHLPGLLGGFAAFIGHLFPIWLGFKGGKGVATYLGVLLGVFPAMVLVFAIVWLSIAKLSRYSSLSALVATLVIPVVLWLIGQPEAALVTAAMTVITWAKHKANIERLISGTEGKIGQKG